MSFIKVSELSRVNLLNIKTRKSLGTGLMLFLFLAKPSLAGEDGPLQDGSDASLNAKPIKNLVVGAASQVYVPGDVVGLFAQAINALQETNSTLRSFAQVTKSCHIAANTEEMRELREAIEAAQAPGGNGEALRRLVFKAAERGNVAILKKLILNYPAFQNALVESVNGECPIHRAAQYGHPNVVRAIGGIYPDSLLSQDLRGFNPAHVAAYYGHPAVLAVMQELSPRALRATTLLRFTVGHLAAQRGHVEVLKSLPIEFLTSASPNERMTPAHLAAENGHIEVLRLFARAASKDRGRLVPAEELRATLAAENSWGQTPAHLAAENGHDEVILEFLKSKNKDVRLSLSSDSNKGEKNGYPAGAAARRGHVKVIEALANSKDERILKTFHPGVFEKSAFWQAAAYRKPEAVKALVRLLPQFLLQKDENGRTLAHGAAGYGFEQLLREILGSEDWMGKRSFLTPDRDGNFPAHEAARSNKAAAIEVFASSQDPEVRATLLARDNQGRTPGNLAGCWEAKQVIERVQREYDEQARREAEARRARGEVRESNYDADYADRMWR